MPKKRQEKQNSLIKRGIRLMEKPADLLEAFSPLLLENHIRMLTIANCIIVENKDEKTTFSITEDDFKKMTDNELQSPLIGINLQYDEKTQKLSANIEQSLYDAYANKLMREVALLYKENYFHRYDKFIRCEK